MVCRQYDTKLYHIFEVLDNTPSPSSCATRWCLCWSLRLPRQPGDDIRTSLDACPYSTFLVNELSHLQITLGRANRLVQLCVVPRGVRPTTTTTSTPPTTSSQVVTKQPQEVATGRCSRKYGLSTMQ